MIARGLLIALAFPSVAALAFKGGARGATALSILADIITLPAFFAVAGWLLAGAVVRAKTPGFSRAIVPAAVCGLAGAFIAAAFAPLAGLGWRDGLALASPAWSMALLTAIYALAARFSRNSLAGCLALALGLHVAGVILGKPALAHFIFFVAGLWLAAHQTQFSGLVDEEPEFSAASAPFVATLAVAVAIRFSQGGLTPSIAAVGPIALALGLAGGPATLACARALQHSAVGQIFGRLGRAAPALALLWIPLFSALMATAGRGAPPSVASACLMALSSLLILVLAADVALEILEKSGIDGSWASTRTMAHR
ncbi:MAG: hypothetical protein ACK5JM_08915 [Rhodoblastus sp.]